MLSMYLNLLYKSDNALKAGVWRIYWHSLTTPASQANSHLYNGLPTYSNINVHIFIKNVILINLFILFHPSKRYSPDTNLGLLCKLVGRSFYRFGCQRRDPVVQSFCSVSMHTTLSFFVVEMFHCHIGWQRYFSWLASWPTTAKLQSCQTLQLE